MDNKYKWCIAAVPGEAWAKKVFPGVRTSTAVENLWNAILFTSRVIDKAGKDLDPVAEWKAHNESFRARCEYLNSLGIKTLEYKSANGTDFTVEMIPEGIFCGGSEHTLGGEEFNPNIPSEEIFTSPKAGCAEGLVVASLPLSYRGQLIENFSVRFEGGKVVEAKAEKGEELLKEMVSMDAGAAMLGECALVPYTSPIRESGITFYETLFDENAACHLALGRGFTNCVKDYDKYTLDELHAMGINESMIHVDFMIGTEDLSVTAVTESGERVAIFVDGNWAF
jgi:aminopeptidase